MIRTSGWALAALLGSAAAALAAGCHVERETRTTDEVRGKTSTETSVGTVTAAGFRWTETGAKDSRHVDSSERILLSFNSRLMTYRQREMDAADEKRAAIVGMLAMFMPHLEPKPLSIERTGKMREVAGYSCEEVVFSDGDLPETVNTACLAADAVPTEWRERLLEMDLGQSASAVNVGLAVWTEQGGYPVAWSVRHPQPEGTGLIESRLTALRCGEDVELEPFAMPAGYESAESVGLGGGESPEEALKALKAMSDRKEQVDSR